MEHVGPVRDCDGRWLEGRPRRLESGNEVRENIGLTGFDFGD